MCAPGLVTLNDMKAKQEALVKEREKQLAKKEQSKELQLWVFTDHPANPPSDFIYLTSKHKSLWFFCVCRKLEKQKEKKRKEEQKRKIASLSFNPDDEGEEEEENEEEELDCEY